MGAQTGTGPRLGKTSFRKLAIPRKGLRRETSGRPETAYRGDASQTRDLLGTNRVRRGARVDPFLPPAGPPPFLSPSTPPHDRQGCRSSARPEKGPEPLKAPTRQHSPATRRLPTATRATGRAGKFETKNLKPPHQRRGGESRRPSGTETGRKVYETSVLGPPAPPSKPSAPLVSTRPSRPRRGPPRPWARPCPARHDRTSTGIRPGAGGNRGRTPTGAVNRGPRPDVASTRRHWERTDVDSDHPLDVEGRAPSL